MMACALSKSAPYDDGSFFAPFFRSSGAIRDKAMPKYDDSAFAKIENSRRTLILKNFQYQSPPYLFEVFCGAFREKSRAGILFKFPSVVELRIEAGVAMFGGLIEFRFYYRNAENLIGRRCGQTCEVQTVAVAVEFDFPA